MKHTPERIANIKAAKNNASRQSVLDAAKDCTLKRDDNQLVIPAHRCKRHITLDEYTEMLKSGMSPKEITTITSKHVVYFYNAMLDGRIKLGKDEFVQLYESGVALEDIAARHGIPRTHATYLREFYGIKRKGGTFQKRLSSEVPLSSEAKSIIIGSILGDGSINPSGCWTEKHCLAQAEYLRWKASFVPDITTDKSFVEFDAYDKRYDKSYKGLSFRTRVHSWLHELGKTFYVMEGKKRVKIVPENIADMLDEMALAVWFMDDGNTDWGYRGGVKTHSGTEPRCIIHTEGFNAADVSLLCLTLNHKFDLSCKPCLKDSKCPNKWVIRLTSQSSRKLTRIIQAVVPNIMQYKSSEIAFVNR